MAGGKMGGERGGLLLPLLSTCAALVVCVAMVAMAGDESVDRFELVDWGALKAQQQEANYKEAFQLDRGTSLSTRFTTPPSGEAERERNAIAKETKSVFPLAKEGVRLLDSKENADQMLKHYDMLSRASLPAEKPVGKDIEKETSGQELARLRKLSDAVLPAEKARALRGKQTGAQMLAHYDHLYASTMPKAGRGAGKAGAVQTSQAMLKHYAALSRAVFPKEKAVKKRVEDV